MVSNKQKENSKKKWNSFHLDVALDEGVTGEYKDKVLTIKGPKGEISKKLKYPGVKILPGDKKIEIKTEKLTQREKKIMLTYQAHVKNMNIGVTQGYEYKLVVLYAKFPMTVELKGQEFVVKNLLGQKVPKTVPIPEDIKVEIKGKDITVSGIDKEKTGQVAASLEQSTRITHLDRRVIQDGIFITEKPKKVYA